MSYSTFPNIVQDRFGHLSGDKAYKDWTPAEYVQQEETIDWVRDYQAGVEQAEKENKPILLAFYKKQTISKIKEDVQSLFERLPYYSALC